MKKTIFFIITLALSASFWGCGDDESTNLRWKNESAQTVQDIQWFVQGSGRMDRNQRWEKNTLTNKYSDYKEITKLHGDVEALVWDNGANDFIEADIDLIGAENATIVTNDSASVEKNTDATLILRADPAK